MPKLQSVPELTELVYKPVSELIKNEALRVSRICVTKFHIDEDEEIEGAAEIKDHLEATDIVQANNETFKMLTLDEHIKRRWEN